MFDVKCSNCGEIYHVNEIHEGRKTKCRKCQEIVLLIENEDSYRKKTNNEDSYYEETNKKNASNQKISRNKNRRSFKSIAYLLLIFVVFILLFATLNERDENSVNELSEYNSLPNETDIYDNNEYIGVNELFVENGTKRDAVIKLKKNNELKRFVYISKDNNVNLSNITSGEYMVYFSLGVDWDEEKNLFQENVSYSKFKDPLVFKGTLTEYTKYEITLHPVVGGQAGTEDINEEEFKLIEEGVESI